VGPADPEVLTAVQGRGLCSWIHRGFLSEWTVPRLRVCHSFFFLSWWKVHFEINIYLSFSSDSGVVNLYDLNTIVRETTNPKPVKSFLNLTTPITQIRFNHDSQIMAICSSQKESAFRLVCFSLCALHPSSFTLCLVSSSVFLLSHRSTFRAGRRSPISPRASRPLVRCSRLTSALPAATLQWATRRVGSLSIV